MTFLSERRKAVLFLVICALLWSTSGVLVKALDWQPLSILAGRGIFTSLVFLLYMRRLPKNLSRWTLLAAGGSIATQFLFITSTKLTTAANSIFLQTPPLLFCPRPLARLHWSSIVYIEFRRELTRPLNRARRSASQKSPSSLRTPPSLKTSLCYNWHHHKQKDFFYG